jgi:DNA-binding NarL/FixJ family response regulator
LPNNRGAIVIRILLADDHDIVRDGLRSILEARHGWEVVSEAANGREAVEKAIETSPNVTILDYAMPFVNGIEAARQIRKLVPGTDILIFTMYDDATVVDQIVQAGARGYILKSEAQSQLARAVQSLAQGKPFFSQVGRFANNRSFKPTALTDRQRSVLQLIAKGHTNKQVARQLGIGLKTVETHRLALRCKLEVETTPALVRYAIRHGIAPLDG